MKRQNRHWEALLRRQDRGSLSCLLVHEWCCRRDLNSRPPPYQGGALPLSYGSAGSPGDGRPRGAHTCQTGPVDARRFSPLRQLVMMRLSKRGRMSWPSNGKGAENRAPSSPGQDPSRANRITAEGRRTIAGPRRCGATCIVERPRRGHAKPARTASRRPKADPDLPRFCRIVGRPWRSRLRGRRGSATTP